MNTNHDTADVAATVTGDAVPLLLLLWQRADLAATACRWMATQAPRDACSAPD